MLRHPVRKGAAAPFRVLSEGLSPLGQRGKIKCFNLSLRAALFAPRSNPESATWTLDCFGAKRRLAMTFEALIFAPGHTAPRHGWRGSWARRHRPPAGMSAPDRFPPAGVLDAAEPGAACSLEAG